MQIWIFNDILSRSSWDDCHEARSQYDLDRFLKANRALFASPLLKSIKQSHGRKDS